MTCPSSAEGVVPVQVDVAPCRRRHLLDQRQGLRVSARLVLRQQPRQDGGVVVDDRVGDQPRALVADLDFEVGPSGQFLLAADLGDGRAELVVGLDAVLRAMHVALQLRVAQVAQRVDAADQLVELEDRPPRRVRRGDRCTACGPACPGSSP